MRGIFLGAVMHKHAIVIGKFMDMHVGHVALINFARNQAEKLTVILSKEENERVDINLRNQWLNNTFGIEVTVFVLDCFMHGLPTKEESDVEVSRVWVNFIKQKFPSVDLIVGSEDYIGYMAREGNLDYTMYDKPRTINPCSSTSVNHGGFKYYCTEAKHSQIKRVIFVGAESTGKTTMVNKISEAMQVRCVVEQARFYMNKDGSYSKHDLIEFALAQELAVLSAVKSATKPLLLIDSSAVTTYTYARRKFGVVNKLLAQLLKQEKADLYIVLAPTVPFTQDGTRKMTSMEERLSFHNETLELLQAMGVNYSVVLADTYSERELQVHELIVSI
jgi:HTH-type transcriptional repressor of NAD biosynthesis genes